MIADDDDLRRAASRLADAAISACDAIREGRNDDDIDAAVDAVRRMYAHAMATHAAMRASVDAP